MKKIFSVIFGILPLLLFSFTFQSDNLFLSYQKIDANNISTYFGNMGVFNTNFETGGPGFEWGPGRYARDISYLVLGARVNGDTLVSIGQEFQPGYIDANGNAQGRDDVNYRVYKISKDDTTGDYVNWPSDQGAYVRKNGKPFWIGDQTLFSSYTDAYSDVHFLSDAPLNATVLETDWAFNMNGPMSNAIFSEFRIINKSTNVWNDFYAGIFTDDNICQVSDFEDVCSDSNLNMGYTIANSNECGGYGSAPPAVSINVMSGTTRFTGDPNDSVAIYRPWTSQNRLVRTGYKNLFLTSFAPFLRGHNSIDTPSNYAEYYRVLQGYKKDGSSWINPNTNLPTKFPCPDLGEGDYRFLISSGQADVLPNDTVTFVIAQLIARGSNNLLSIGALKTTANLISHYFRNNFFAVEPVEPTVVVNLPDNYKLHQNYPNPFNPSTKIRYSLAESIHTKLIVYDINGREVRRLMDGFEEAGDKEVIFNGTNLPSGIYFYKLSIRNISATLKMVLQK